MRILVNAQIFIMTIFLLAQEVKSCNSDQYEFFGCQNCKSECATCSSGYSCDSCVPGYYMGDWGQCKPCPASCALWQSSSNCISCRSGYYKSGTSCPQCTSPCATCSNASSCTTCISTYYLSGSSCLACSKPCGNCSGTATNCTSCIDSSNQSTPTCDCTSPAKYLDTTTKMCLNCVSPCINCSTVTQCDSCVATYYLSGTTCVPCTKPCANCSVSGTNYSTCIDSNHQTAPSCQCNSGYIINASYSCDQCTFTCATCQTSATNCTSCVTGLHRYLSSNTCICHDGYYDNGTCQSCTLPCIKCSSSTVCLSCNDAAHQQLSQCSCIDTYYMDSSFICQSCVSPCKNCTNATDCTSCIDTYYLTGSVCNPCTIPCQNCTSNSTNCTSCAYPNQIVSSGSCICDDGYYMDNSQQCQTCIHPCSKCSTNESHCLDCVSTFILSTTTPNTCECPDKYYEDTTTTNCKNEILTQSLCFKCPDNCQVCQLNEIQKRSECTQCKQGYFVLDILCKQCADRCLECGISATDCTKCRFLKINDKCGMCEQQNGYYSDFQTNQCYSKCGDSFKTLEEECDDGNQINNDGCDKNCKLEKKFQCKDGICITPEYPFPSLSSIGDSSLFNRIRQFKLEYNVLLNISSNLNYSADVELSIVANNQLRKIDYPYLINPQIQVINQSYTNFSVLLEIQLNRSSKDEIFQIRYLNLSQYISYQGYVQQENIFNTSIAEFQQIDEATVAQVQMATNSNEYALYVLAVMGGCAIIFGGLDIFYNLLDTIQMLSYLKYINTQFPFNLQEFFDFFGFAQLNFISKYFDLQGLIDPYIAYENLKPIPSKISNDDYNSLFIINGSSILVVWISLLAVFISSIFLPKLLHTINFKYYTEIPGKKDLSLKIKLVFLAAKIFVSELCYIIVSEFFYSGVFRTLLATAYDYNFSMVLQLNSLEVLSKDLLVRISSYLALGALGIYFFSVFLIAHICGQPRYSFENYEMRLRYGSLFEGISKNSFSKYFNSILLVKKFLFMVILITTYNQPVIQSMNLVFLSVLSSLFLLISKPLEDDKEYKKQISCEINTTCCLVLVNVLVFDSELQCLSISTRDFIGWICVGNITLILIIQFIIDATQQWQLLIKKYKQIKNLVERIQQLFSQPLHKGAEQNLFINP